MNKTIKKKTSVAIAEWFLKIYQYGGIFYEICN